MAGVGHGAALASPLCASRWGSGKRNREKGIRWWLTAGARAAERQGGVGRW
jgi:hypothetical protein